jgi:DNA polymerase-1
MTQTSEVADKEPSAGGVATPAAAVAAGLAAAREPKVDRAKYETVTTLERLSAWIAKATDAGRVAFDTETTALSARAAELVGVSLAVQPGAACYIPLAHAGPGGDLFGETETAPAQIKIADAIAALKPLLADPGVLKIAQNVKYDALVLKSYGVDIAPVDDTMLMSYALDGGRGAHGMDSLAERHLGHVCMSFEQALALAPGARKSDKTFAHAPIDKATEYAAEDADVTLRLWLALKPRLAAERMTTVYETLERPLAPVIVEMEHAGVKVDAAILSRLSGAFSQRAARLEQEVYDLAGHKFNGRRAPNCSTISRRTRSFPTMRANSLT